SKQLAHAFDVPTHCRIYLGVGAFKINVRNYCRTAVSRTRQKDHVSVMLSDQSIEVYIHQVQTWRCPPMTKQARLDVLRLERLTQQRIFLQVNLPDGEVIRRVPVPLDPVEKFERERTAYSLRRLRCSALRNFNGARN